jgi:hypothetical protein
MKQGFRPEQIALLTCRGVTNSVFSSDERVGGLPLRRFTGDYDLLGNQMMSEGRLLFDSVYRFKGQEMACVVLVDVDPDPAELERALALVYVGGTRATVRLDILARAGNPVADRWSLD